MVTVLQSPLKAHFMGLRPAKRGLASAFQAEAGTPPVPSSPFFLQVATATVWRVAEPTAHPTSDGRRGDLKEKERNRHFALCTPT